VAAPARDDTTIGRRDSEIEASIASTMFHPLPMPAIDSVALHVDDVRVSAGDDIFAQGDRAQRTL
jgi:hypothetical protein